MVNQVAVILAGGTGTRLYPASRAHRPKQVLAFAGDEPLLRRAADRAGFLDSMYVITSARYRRAVEDLVPEATVLVEPAPRDTGPALVYAAHEIRALEDDPVLLCLPSDHVVGDGFERDARTALRAARETGGLVTLGIQPDRPATEYGYIDPGPVEDGYGPIEAFHEKPDEATAEAYIGEGALWNSGIFAWRPSALLEAARESPLAPLTAALAAGDAERGFHEVPAESIDTAVLERADDVFVVPADVQWDDLGSWDALYRLLEGENAVAGEATTIDATGNVIATDDETHVSLIGAEDLVVAAFEDRVLVIPREEAQRVRELVTILEDENRF